MRGRARFRILAGMMLFALGGSACSEVSGPTRPSAAAGSGATEARGGSQLPFRGELETSETADGPRRLLTGTGTATHLGRFTLAGDFTVDPATRMGSGTAVWTAANGDQIFTTVTGQGVLTFPMLALVETHTITGGTGRFAGASGTLIVERALNVQTGMSTATVSGTLNLNR